MWPRISQRWRNRLWDIVAMLAAGGIIYGALGYIAQVGVWKGLAISVGAVIFGLLAVSMVYPLWFRQ